MAGFEAANRDMELARELTRRRGRKRRLGALVSAIDDLLFSLEELNLRGVDRVPAHLRDRAAGIIRLVRPAAGPTQRVDRRIRVRYRVRLMMDVLFEVQARVLRRRNPSRAAGGSSGATDTA